MSSSDPLAAIWAHAVNSMAALNAAMSSETTFIECDLGLVVNNELFCAHYPTELTSDLPFISLFSTWLRVQRPLGLKIDLKRPELIPFLLASLSASSRPRPGPLWLNADVFGSKRKMEIKDLENFIPHVDGFSLGLLGPDAFENISEHIQKVHEFAAGHNFHVTFAMNAHQATSHVPEIHRLLSSILGSSVTLWTTKGESIDSQKFSDLVQSLPVNRVYADVTLTVA